MRKAMRVPTAAEPVLGFIVALAAALQSVPVTAVERVSGFIVAPAAALQ